MCRKRRKFRKDQKRGEMFSPHPPGFRHYARARDAERSALAATGRRPPPQRHTEPRSGEGVWGAQLPTVFPASYFRILRTQSFFVSRNSIWNQLGCNYSGIHDQHALGVGQNRVQVNLDDFRVLFGNSGYSKKPVNKGVLINREAPTEAF
jgi:hypothetical protein